MALKGSIATILMIFHLNVQVLLWAFLRKKSDTRLEHYVLKETHSQTENTLKGKHQREKEHF